MSNVSYREDGKTQFSIMVTCGSQAGFSSNWTPTSKYTVRVCEDDPFTEIVEQIRKQAGPQSKADKIYGISKRGGEKKIFDLNKTIKENGITDTNQNYELRFPSLLG
eukprot:TRINITY_DN2201_c0_g1_i1.p1 TRINITY_DN2201_c0_g1~~TRINITY_DN2201_c0_g1_i1.p1  ORF type:complete len:107 (-),score=30.50 TRINITY_DN2201_c0_g1_i1:88-408(-)